MENYLTPADVAKVLNVTPRTVYQAIRSGRLKASKPMGQWLLTEQAVRDFVEGGQRAWSPPPPPPAPVPSAPLSLKQMKGRPRR